MAQATKIIGTGLATTGLVGVGVGISVMLGALILGVIKDFYVRGQLFNISITGRFPVYTIYFNCVYIINLICNCFILYHNNFTQRINKYFISYKKIYESFCYYDWLSIPALKLYIIMWSVSLLFNVIPITLLVIFTLNFLLLIHINAMAMANNDYTVVHRVLIDILTISLVIIFTIMVWLCISYLVELIIKLIIELLKMAGVKFVRFKEQVRSWGEKGGKKPNNDGGSTQAKNPDSEEEKKKARMREIRRAYRERKKADKGRKESVKESNKTYYEKIKNTEYYNERRKDQKEQTKALNKTYYDKRKHTGYYTKAARDERKRLREAREGNK